MDTYEQFAEHLVFQYKDHIVNNARQVQSISMQAQKSSRRKRKDPESRDFTCSCGKTYLSYAAAYTHVKNKHHLDKQILNDIGKPAREKLPRGRPKQKKQILTTLQTEELSVMEEAILKMYELLHHQFQKMILEGNQSIPNDQLDQAYLQLLVSSSRANQHSKDRANHQDLKFIEQFSIHFSTQVAARVKFVGLALSESDIFSQNSSEFVADKVINDLNCCDLWRGKNQVNSIICQAYCKWKSLAH